MRVHRVTRVALQVILAGAGVGWFAVAQLEPAELSMAESPHPEEILLMEEFAAWAGEVPTSDPDHPFPEDDSLVGSIAARAASFRLFCEATAVLDPAHILSGLPFAREIAAAAERAGVDPLLVAAMVEAESSFDPAAVSPVGAVGLMQVMPETALALGLPELTDPAVNLRAGARYLREMLHRFEDDVTLALAAYNAGPSNVERFDGVPPFAETTRYVDRVLRRYLEHRRVLWQAVAPDGVTAAGL